jgi:putative transcriptional regulator
MSARNRITAALALVLPVLATAWTAPGYGAELPDTVLLVARPELQDPVYGETILIAWPAEQGRHCGFILNKPTKISLADAIPDHDPAKAVRAPVYLGGPANLGAVFALVASHDSPGRGSVPLSPDLFLVTEADTVDHVIESKPGRARFFAGTIIWQPGELEDELERGAWYVLDAEADLALPEETGRMWQKLVKRAEIRENGI